MLFHSLFFFPHLDRVGFSWRRSTRSLGRQPAAAGDQPGLRAVSTHSVRGHSMYFKIFHRAQWPGKTPRPLGFREGPVHYSHCHTRAGYSLSFGGAWRIPPLQARKGLKTLSQKKPDSRSRSPQPLAQQQRGRLSSRNRPEQLLWLRSWKCISGARRRPLRSDPSPGSTWLP